MSDAQPDPADDATAALAARRRGRKSGRRTAPPPVPAPQAPEAAPGEEPPTQIKVSRSALADYLLRTDGYREFGRPAGVYEPVLSPGKTVPLRGDYVTADFDAWEELIPLRAKTPVTRLLFRRGWFVRRDVYDEIVRQRREGASSQPVELPTADEVPPPLSTGPTVGAPAGN